MARKHKRLGELVIRSANPEALVSFYQDVIGLEIYASFGRATFFKVDDDFEGHPQLLAIFDKSHTFSGPEKMQPAHADSGTGTLHHFAFVLELKEFISERERLQNLGVDLQFAEHATFGWRSIYMFDPDGNSVEFVCYDASVFDPEANKLVRK